MRSRRSHASSPSAAERLRARPELPEGEIRELTARLLRGSGALSPAPGVVVAVDVGTVRVGVAASDPHQVLASPVVTLQRDAAGASDLAQLAALVTERQAVEVVVGLPRTLAGKEGSAVEMARAYAAELAERVAPVPVVLVDERLTTVSAAAALRASGKRAKQHRALIDQAAAVALLQGHLDSRR